MRELAPGVPVIELDARYAIDRLVVHDAGAQVRHMPLVVRSDADPWSDIVSFLPAAGDPVLPEGFAALGWLTRVDQELLSGSAWLACTDPSFPLTEQFELRPHGYHVDLISNGALASGRVLLRQGARETTTLVRVDGFRSYALVDDQAVHLRPPSGVALAPMPRWSRFYGTPDPDLATRVRFLRFARLEEPRVMPWLESLDVVIAPGEQISQAMYVSGLYEPCTADVLRRVLKPGDTFVDVGANIGLFTLLAARWVGPGGRVLAVEPSQREFVRLQDHLRRNGLRHVSAVRMAAGLHSGTATLRVATVRHGGLNTLESQFMYPDVREAYTEAVEVAPLDDILPASGIGIDRVHVMKIDVEGSEHDVIAGARRTITRDRPVIIVELAGAALAPGHAGRTALEAFLGSLEYRFAAIDGDAAVVRPVQELTAPAENFIAARPDVLARLRLESASI